MYKTSKVMFNRKNKKFQAQYNLHVCISHIYIYIAFLLYKIFFLVNRIVIIQNIKKKGFKILRVIILVKQYKKCFINIQIINSYNEKSIFIIEFDVVNEFLCNLQIPNLLNINKKIDVEKN